MWIEQIIDFSPSFLDFERKKHDLTVKLTYTRTEITDGDLSNCEFHDILFEKDFRGNINSSKFYQAIWGEKTDSDFTDCDFFNTEFEKGIQGAALSGKFYNTQLNQVAFCKFSNCRFYNDGSISVFKTITSCTFESCTLEKNDFTKIAVTNTLFSNNIFNEIFMIWASMKKNTFKSLEMNGGSAENFDFEEIDLETPGINLISFPVCGSCCKICNN